MVGDKFSESVMLLNPRTWMKILRGKIQTEKRRKLRTEI